MVLLIMLVYSDLPVTPANTKHCTKHLYNVFAADPTLYKYFTNVLCLLGRCACVRVIVTTDSRITVVNRIA